jgi:hypothetical protein
LWNWSDVVKAVPYLHSIVGSLREHWLDVLNAQKKIDKAAARKGLAKRQQIIEDKAHEHDQIHAQGKFDEALDELTQMDVFLLDPVRGIALVPFRKGDDLAWYVFDHFAKRGVIGWRLHDDPIDRCRPLEIAEKMPEAVAPDADAVAK